MNFTPRILFLITALVCLIYVIKKFIDGPAYDGTFWIAIMWIFMGFYLYKYPQGKKVDENK